MQRHFLFGSENQYGHQAAILNYWTSKFVTAIFQQLLDELFSNFVHRFPLGPCCATSLFIQIWKPIWPPDGHLEFWTSKFVTVTFHQLLYGLFSNFIYRFPLQPLAKINYKSPWPIFHGPVIFLYNSKVFWRIFMKLGHHEYQYKMRNLEISI